jgi:hypothetical protein
MIVVAHESVVLISADGACSGNPGPGVGPVFFGLEITGNHSAVERTRRQTMGWSYRRRSKDCVLLPDPAEWNSRSIPTMSGRE